MPFPANTPAPDDLSALSPREIADLPVAILAMLQSELDERLQRDKAAKASFDAALASRYADRAVMARIEAGKDTGTIRFDDGDFTIVADLPKRVDWDQHDLGRLVEHIKASGDDPHDYVDITFKISERKYAAWPRQLRDTFAVARTVRPGTLKIEIVPQEGGQ